MQAAVYANNASMGDKLIEEVPYKDGNFSSLAIFLSSLRPRKEKYFFFFPFTSSNNQESTSLYLLNSLLSPTHFYECSFSSCALLSSPTFGQKIFTTIVTFTKFVSQLIYVIDTCFPL